MHIAFLGLGAMGARMAAHLDPAALTVWNRSPGPTASFHQRGATVAMTPREAATGADLVIAMVTDDDASRAVWTGADGALAGLAPDAVAVESSTLTPGWVRELAGLAEQRGARFLDAPVSGSRPQADAASLVYLVGGDADALAVARPAFDAIGGAVHHLGPVGQGALVKLAVNALMGVQVAAAAELLAALAASGVDRATAAEVLGATPAASPVAATAMRLMAAGDDDPLFPVDLLEKDLRYALGMAAAAGVDAPAVDAARATFARAQAAGLGDRNMTAVARLYTDTP
ncbi:NAD(P)-dependent oxidoreductase [Rubrivirga sp. IMCC45206]|uniref:NAD(P)-dependent oxidoreductase n=1 Tax=Rubrivirga sp. IMCC45206 TaxID=3391614 RepID=UPI00398FABD5